MILSGRELFALRKQQNLSLPQKAGVKDYAPDGSQLQQTKLENFLLDRKDALAEPRVQRIGSVVRGSWNKKKYLIEFEQEVGKFWSHMGFVDEQRKWLYPEEGLYLMEANVLEVRFCGIPLSLQQAYAAFLGHSITLDQYQVYAHLRRIGYVLRRYGSMDERRRTHPEKSKDRKHKLEADEEAVHSPDEQVVKRKCISDDNVMDVSENVPTETLSTTDSSPGYYSAARDYVCTSGEDTGFCDKPNDPSLCSAVEPCDLTIPCIAGVTEDVIKLNIPPSHLIPHNLSANDEDIFINISNIQRESRKEEKLEFSFEKFNSRKLKGANWAEYKCRVQNLMRSCDEIAVDSPVAHLWQGEVTPLVKPQDALSTGAILNKLQIIENIQEPQTVSTVSIPEVKFDVYLPDAKFKKGCPGKPNHRICVLSANDPTPSLAVLTSVSQLSGDDVPVHWAVIDNGDIAFYNFNHVDLPVQCD